MQMIVRMEVEVVDYWPRTSRVLEVEGDWSLGKLHEVLQTAFEWERGHAYQFSFPARSRRKEWETVIDEVESPRWKILDWLKRAGAEGVYRVDAGTGWEHRIRVEDVFEIDPERGYPNCPAAEGELPEKLTVPPMFVPAGTRTPSDLCLDANNSFIKFDGMPDAYNPDVHWSGTFCSEDEDGDGPASLEDFEKVRSTLRKGTVNATRAMKELYDEKPWDRLDNRQIIAIELEGTREPFFVSVLGSDGKEFGLVLYYGWDGYRILRREIAGTLAGEEAIHGLPGMFATFIRRKEMFLPERKMFRELGFTFPDDGWPLMRVHEPGYMPNPPMPHDFIMLEEAIKAVKTVSRAAAEHGLEVPRLGEDPDLLVFRPAEPGTGEMYPELIPVPGEPAAHRPGLRVKDHTLWHILRLPVKDERVEFDVSFWPSALREEGWPRMYHPLAVFGADADSGELISRQFLSRPAPDVMAQAVFADFLIFSYGAIPAEVLMTQETERRIRPLLDKLDLRGTVVGRLPGIEAAKEKMRGGLPV